MVASNWAMVTYTCSSIPHIKYARDCEMDVVD